MRRSPNRTRIPASYPHIRGSLARVDADLASGARTTEAVFLRIVREFGTWAQGTATELELAKCHSRALAGRVLERFLCGHEI